VAIASIQFITRGSQDYAIMSLALEFTWRGALPSAEDCRSRELDRRCIFCDGDGCSSRS
jgi:hypothetical protein